MPDNASVPASDYRLWTLAKALGLGGVSDVTAIASCILDQLPGGSNVRDLPAACHIVGVVLNEDIAWAASSGGHAVVDWRSIELELTAITSRPPAALPGSSRSYYFKSRPPLEPKPWTN